MSEGQPHYSAAELFALGSQAGAVLGVLLGPIAAFGFMRRVTLGRLLAATTLGATRGGFVGFVAGALVLPHGLAIASVISGGVVGFGVAALRQRWDANSPSARLPSTPTRFPPAALPSRSPRP